MTLCDYLSSGLAFLGTALICWACGNPKWRHQDAYEALTPFLSGVFLLIVAVVILVASAISGYFQTGAAWMAQ